jgi:hypothetical protein
MRLVMSHMVEMRNIVVQSCSETSRPNTRLC